MCFEGDRRLTLLASLLLLVVALLLYHFTHGWFVKNKNR